jgi:hypothetical protein
MRLKAEGRRFDPAPDHQFCNVISEFGRLRGANRHAPYRAKLPVWGRPRDAVHSGTKAVGATVNIMSGQKVDPRRACPTGRSVCYAE